MKLIMTQTSTDYLFGPVLVPDTGDTPNTWLVSK